MTQTTNKQLEFELEYTITREIHVFRVDYTVKETSEVGVYDEYGNGLRMGDWDYSIDSIIMIDEEGNKFDYSNKEDVIKEAINQIEEKES